MAELGIEPSLGLSSLSLKNGAGHLLGLERQGAWSRHSLASGEVKRGRDTRGAQRERARPLDWWERAHGSQQRGPAT